MCNECTIYIDLSCCCVVWTWTIKQFDSCCQKNMSTGMKTKIIYPHLREAENIEEEN